MGARVICGSIESSAAMLAILMLKLCRVGGEGWLIYQDKNSSNADW